MGLAPLVFWLTLEDPFRLPKLLVSETLALLSCAFLSLRLGKWRPREVLREPVPQIALILVAAAAISGIGTAHPEHWRAAGWSLLVAAAAASVWSLTLSRNEVRRALDWMIPPALLSAGFVLLQASGWLQPFEFAQLTRDRIGLTAVAGGPFDLSAWLVIPALILQDRLVRGERRKRTAVALVLVVGGILATQTFATIGAALLGSLVLWWWHTRDSRRFGMALAVFVCLAIAALVPLRGRLMAKVSSLETGRVDLVFSGRLDGWRTALEVGRTHPWNGAGHGTYRAEFPHAKEGLLAEGVRFFGGHRHAYFANAHNELLEAWAEWGLLGLSALVAALLLARRGLRGRKKLEGWELGTLVAILLVSLVDFPFRIALLAYPWVLFLVGVFGSEEEEGERRRDIVKIAWPVGLVFLLMTVVSIDRGRERFHASKILRGASALVDEVQGAPRQWMEGAVDQLAASASAMPEDVRFLATRGSLQLRLQRPSAAVRSYQQALELEARPEIRANLGMALLDLGREEEGLRELRRAMQLEPGIRRRLRRSNPELWERLHETQAAAGEAR